MRLLVVGHAATRSGSPMVLLRLVRWLRHNTDWQVDVALRQAGPLLDDFRATAHSVHVLANGWHKREPWRVRPERVTAQGYDVVLCNSAPALRSLADAPRAPVVAFLHELHGALRRTLPGVELRRLTDLPCHFVVPAHVLKAMLTKDFGVSDADITVVHELIDVDQVPCEPLPDSGDQMVLGCGTVEARKGTDLFLQLALTYRRLHPHAAVRFTWLGTGLPDDEADFRDELLKASNPVELLPHSEEVLRVISSSRVLALTSREDPFPLVALEAALTGRPVLCFRGAGGMEELAEARGGVAVPYLDVASMAGELHALLNDPVRAAAMGAAARRFAAGCDTSLGAPRIRDVLAAVASIG